MKSLEVDDFVLITKFPIQYFENNSEVIPTKIACLEPKLE